MPETLYEYEYRFKSDGIWTDWYPTPLYFTTQTLNIFTAIGEHNEIGIALSPNPAMDQVQLSGLPAGDHDALVLDGLGRTIWKGILVNGMLDTKACFRATTY